MVFKAYITLPLDLKWVIWIGFDLIALKNWIAVKNDIDFYIISNLTCVSMMAILLFNLFWKSFFFRSIWCWLKIALKRIDQSLNAHWSEISIGFTRKKKQRNSTILFMLIGHSNRHSNALWILPVRLIWYDLEQLFCYCAFHWKKNY